TDGPGSNNALDMFREMYLACVLQKLSLGDAAAMDALKVLKMACSGSALAMGLTDCDCIDAGKQADMIVIDLSRPAMQPINNVAKNIVYSGSRDCVKLTMIAGKILCEDGKFHLPDSAEEVYANCNRIVAEMTAE
ncbi:MAG: amidohydrolase family protein, partial [Oscillospiraceae bacterium]|nr:amidohydrolase family protein [Oscillospiraceae bacterium]